MKRARPPALIATFDGYEVRINLARTLVFLTSDSRGQVRSRVLSLKAALDPETEIRPGVEIPRHVRAAIRTRLATPNTPGGTA